MAPKWTKRAWPGRKWPNARVRSTEIYQTRPPFVGLKHDKFRSFRERGRSGGHFLKGRGDGLGGRVLIQGSDSFD